MEQHRETKLNLSDIIWDLDFRFIENYYELDALGHYLNFLEDQLSSIIKQKEENARLELLAKKDMDEVEFAEIHQKLNDVIYELLPRFFRSPFLVTLYAVAESAINEVADYLKKQKNKSLCINDIKGSGFIDQAKKYFSNVLEFKLFSDSSIIDRLDMLRILRNAVAHSNGRLERIKENDRIKIKKWKEDNIGISLLNNSIIFSDVFLRETYKIIYTGINDLLDRAKAAYPEKHS